MPGHFFTHAAFIALLAGHALAAEGGHSQTHEQPKPVKPSKPAKSELSAAKPAVHSATPTSLHTSTHSSIHSAPHSNPSKGAASVQSESAPKGTPICGTLRLAEEWTLRGSPYIITGDVFIPATSRLRIEAGVEVRFQSKPSPCESEQGRKPIKAAKPEHDEKSEHDHHPDPSDAAKKKVVTERDPLQPPPPRDFSDSTYTTLSIEGAFYCLGMPGKPVRFMPADTTPGSPPWDAVRLMGQREGRAEIAFAEFRGANVGLYVERAEFYIHHSVFEGNNTGLWCGPHADVTPMFNVFTRNRSTGLLIDKAVPHVINNIFWKNTGHGIWSDGRKSMIIAYNAFYSNGEDDCYRCAHDILPLGEGGVRDTVDAHGNRHADPVFIDSESFKALRLKDPRYDTPKHLIKDTALAAAEKKSRWRWFKGNDSAQAFTPRGQGPWRLSEYSPLRNAGHPARTLRNTDGSRSDLGIWGGPQDRITKNPFLGM